MTNSNTTHSQTPSVAPATDNRVLETQTCTVSSPTKSTKRLTPGEWLRVMDNVRAPFGFDRMPTVWG